MEETTTGLDYAHGRISTLFRKIFIPTLLGMMFTALITIVDGVFVGQGVGPEGIAAVNIIAPLYMVSTGIGLMLGIGASVVCGMCLAGRDNARANAVMSQAFLAGTAVMALIVACSLLFTAPVARLLGSSDLLMPLAVDYLAWLMPGCLFLTWSSIGMMVIRLDGSPKYAMMINIIPAVLNIIGDYVLIFPCGMGVKGAAVATAASLVVGGVMAIAYFRFSYVLRLTKSMRGFVGNLASVAAIGSSAFVTEIAMSVMMLTGNLIFMRYFGEPGVAAYSIACYLFPLMFMMSNAVAQSAQPIISYNNGISAMGRVREAFVVSLRVAMVCGLIVTTAIVLGAPGIVEMFIPASSEAGVIACKGLPIFATCAVFFAVNIAFIGYFQSLGLAMRAMILTLLRGMVFLVPLFYLLPALFPAWGMWAAIPASEAVTLVVILATRRRNAP